KVTRLDNGYLRAPARLTRAGVFEYLRPDGSVKRELRHPDDVFAPESIGTLPLGPLTLGHPPEMLDARNTRKYSIGSTGEVLNRSDDDHVESTVMVTDADAVSSIDLGTTRDLSCGYHCDMLDESGEWEGQAYDARQVNIRYNHVAVLPRGRAGTASIRLDENDDILL